MKLHRFPLIPTGWPVEKCTKSVRIFDMTDGVILFCLIAQHHQPTSISTNARMEIYFDPPPHAIVQKERLVTLDEEDALFSGILKLMDQVSSVVSGSCFLVIRHPKYIATYI